MSKDHATILPGAHRLRHIRTERGLQPLVRKLSEAGAYPLPELVQDGRRRLAVGRPDGDRAEQLVKASVHAALALASRWYRAGFEAVEVDAEGHLLPAKRLHVWTKVEGRTSPSGKTLFACSFCKVETPLPDTSVVCRSRPNVFSKGVLALMERALAEGAVFELVGDIPMPAATRRDLV